VFYQCSIALARLLTALSLDELSLDQLSFDQLSMAQAIWLTITADVAAMAIPMTRMLES
jgi:hypothetical protein